MRIPVILRIPLLAAMAAMFVGCASKTADEEAPEPIPGDSARNSNVVSTNPSESPPAAPARPTPVFDDGLRLPDMLTLPSERDLRKPAQPPSIPEGGGVSARPPVSD